MPRVRNRRRPNIRASSRDAYIWPILITGASLTVLCQIVAVAGTLSIFKIMTPEEAIAINVILTAARLMFISRPGGTHVAMIVTVLIAMYFYWLFALNYGFGLALAVAGLDGVAWLSWAAAAALLFLPDFLVVYGLGIVPAPININTGN